MTLGITTGRFVLFACCAVLLAPLLGSCGDDSTQPEGDALAPSAVTDLTVGSMTLTGAVLTWTSVGDDDSTGTARFYDVRYSTNSGAGWDQMTPASDEPGPSAPKHRETFVVTGLQSDRTYYFQLKVGDEVPNWSPVSNRVTGATEDMAALPIMVLIQPGSFTMGSPVTELGRESDEDLHQVILTKAFYISKYELTQHEWVSVMGPGDSYFPGELRPQDSLTWDDAARFCNQLSVRQGLSPAYTITDAVTSGGHIVEADVRRDPASLGYRLPTEAEWEYACRATSQSAFCNGGISTVSCAADSNLEKVGWYCGNTTSTHEVGGRPPNSWGLFDMHGNVMEWCEDWYAAYRGAETDPEGPATGYNKVTRGGGWNADVQDCRSARRDFYPSNQREHKFGLRIVRTAPPTP
jgi:formylglycine-generating enzyme required for sulfatase activity